MSDETNNVDVPARLLLPIYRSDVKDMIERAGSWHLRDERAVQMEEPELITPSRVHNSIVAGWLRRCYGSVMNLVGSRARQGDWDVEAAVEKVDNSMEGTVSEPSGLVRGSAPSSYGKDRYSDVGDEEYHRTFVDRNAHSPNRRGLAALSIRSNSSPRLLSDEENARMNKKIDRLVAAINHRRPIHFEPDVETGEVEIFADHEVSDRREEDDLERDIAGLPENFGRVIRFGNGVCRIRSLHSLRHATSTDSWASTDSNKSSSNAWERAVAAANVRFALEYGAVDQGGTVVRRPVCSSDLGNRVRRSRKPDRTISPIPLNFNKPLRLSTPSVHSNGSEQDTSSPLFGKSCERILRETYARLPESNFERGVLENSQLDERASISEPHDVPSFGVHEPNAPVGTGRKFGVFQDSSNGESQSKEIAASAVRSKVLKDISNLRRPGYLQFNSFAKNAKETNGREDTDIPTTVSSTSFGGAPDAASKRAYINKKRPVLSKEGSSSMAKPSSLDGNARRRNEQAVGHPVDKSLYSLSHVKTSRADSSPDVDPTRQAHFDLALARLEGRALPPPTSPIHRHPDWAALYDRDVQIEGSHRPLHVSGPTPSRPANPSLRRFSRRYFRRIDGPEN